MSIPVQPSGAFGGVQVKADNAKAVQKRIAGISQMRVVIIESPMAVAARPHHPQPGKRMPAAVTGLAQPVMPKGGRLIRIHAIA